MKIPSWMKKMYFRYCFRVKKGKCLFIPHPGFCKNDKASIINYKADNCLIFVRYMLDNNLCKDKELVVISTTQERAEREQAFCREHYPEASIRIIPDVSRQVKSAWASAEYIISSEARFSTKKKRGQQYIVLGYYAFPIKRDWFPPIKGTWFGNRIEFAKEIDKFMSSSLVSSQMESSSYEISFGKFVQTGRCRSDVLLRDEDVSFVRDYFKQACGDYNFSRIILYPPTHRDYEQSEFDVKRSILGFDVNKEKFEKFLKDNELLIVCKLHPRQNANVVSSDLPKGVINFTGSEEFGLTELMKASDMLMTDYSTAYIDYLLLEKPVVFNFYDYKRYEKERGFAVYPINRICAGEMFFDEDSFYQAVTNTIKEPDKYGRKRKELIEYMHTYRTEVCKETYKAIFNG